MNKLLFAFALGATMFAFANDADEFGGEITVWPENAGLFVFVNAQTKVSDADLNKPLATIMGEFSIRTKLITKKGGEFDVRKVPAELKGLDAKGGIWLVDDPSLPVTMVSPEDGWGLINTARLTADSPDAKKLETRLMRFLNRTFANLHGAADPLMMPACVMKPAVGIKGVDALLCTGYSPETHSKVAGYLTKAGYKSCQSGTYMDACEEGWAPAPTNDVQKAIWKKVHELPTKPLTIQRESERKK